MSYLTNPYMVTAVTPPLDPIDFTVLSNWTQSPTGTVTWSSGSPNYARTNTLLASGSDWEFTCDPSASNWGAGITGSMGISLSTDTPDHLFKFNYCWYNQSPDEIGYWYVEADGSNAVASTSTYTDGAIYSIKCVSDAVTFYKDGEVVVAPTSAYNFDSSVNTMARFSVGQASLATTIVTCTGES